MDRRHSLSRRIRHAVPASLLLFLLPLLHGCSTFSTYPPDGPGIRTYPWIAPGPEVMATGLGQARARIDPESEFVFNLPPGISQMAWDDVQRRLGPGARPMQPGDEVVWDLERYGISNTKAFADIGYWNDGSAMLVTVSMERRNIAPFRVTHVQRWYVELQPPVCNNPRFTNVDPVAAADAGTESASDPGPDS